MDGVGALGGHWDFLSCCDKYNPLLVQCALILMSYIAYHQQQ